MQREHRVILCLLTIPILGSILCLLTSCILGNSKEPHCLLTIPTMGNKLFNTPVLYIVLVLLSFLLSTLDITIYKKKYCSPLYKKNELVTSFSCNEKFRNK